MLEEPEAEPTAAESEINEIEDVAALKQAVVQERTQAEANLAGWQRAQADFINYKRRTEKEKGEIGEFAMAALILGLLPVLDDLERAFVTIPDELAEISWVEGMRMIQRKLWTAFEGQGLSLMTVIGEPFDPNLHEAVMQYKGKEGMVVDELEKGYMFHGKVIRPAKVVVGNGEEEE